jgi:hypothetical protein
MRVLSDIERRVKRTHRRRPKQQGSRAKRNDGRCRSGAWLRAAHVELVCAWGARDVMLIIDTVFGRTAVDSTWSNDSHPNEPYPRLFRADLTGGFRLVNVVPPGTEYLPHLKRLDIRVAKVIRAGRKHVVDTAGHFLYW